MHVRHMLDLECSYCGDENIDVYYSPANGIFTFKCEFCDKINYINSKMQAIHLTRSTAKDIKESILCDTVNAGHSSKYGSLNAGVKRLAKILHKNAGRSH